jgi:hypothetical protein
MAVIGGQTSGVFYQNDSSEVVLATVCVRATQAACRFSPTADPADEVTVSPNQVECRTYRIDAGQGISIDSGGEFATISLEILATPVINIAAP